MHHRAHASKKPSRSPAAPAPSQVDSSHPVLELQRMIGNRATLTLLQRDDNLTPDQITSTEGQWLPPKSVKRAIRFYDDYASEYTPFLIQEIQMALGRPATGLINEAEVQAIAGWQIANDIGDVDGIAGSRTLAAMFPDGLAEQDDMDAFLEDVGQTESDWADLDADERRARFAELVNERLRAISVPEVTLATDDDLEVRGVFNPLTWRVTLPVERINEAANPDGLRDVYRTLYHEARHAEQHYQIARWMAGQGRSARQIHRETEMPLPVVEQAAQNPMAGDGVEAVIAHDFYRSSYGSRVAYNEAVYAKARKAKRAVQRAERAYEADPSEANAERLAKAREQLEQARVPYEYIAEEHDAHQVSDALVDRHDELAEEATE
jgi:hypothetical protein